jgi:YD repeat-containing protein
MVCGLQLQGAERDSGSMVKKTIGILWVVVMLGVIAVLPVAGQSCRMEKTVIGFPETDPSFHGTLAEALGLPANYTCDPHAEFEIPCFWYTSSCPPDQGPFETRCQSCNVGPQGGSPIDLATGDVFITQTDINLPGLGGGLHLTRTWHSLWPVNQVGLVPFMFGPNWMSSYQERVYTGNDGYIKYARNDGSFWSLAPQGSSITNYATAAPANAGTTAIQDPNTNGWIITLKNGERHTFDQVTGSLTSIIDRNGNTTTLSYDGLNRIANVADPAGRHLFFNYVNSSSFLVGSVTSDVGITWTYAYDTQGRLSQITKPDQSTVSFQYDANSNVTAVLTGGGVILESHTYDLAHRGLTSSRANGVESLTVQYSTPAGATVP